MRVLEKDEKILYDTFMLTIPMEKIDCWDIKTPSDFENHKPCEDSKDW